MYNGILAELSLKEVISQRVVDDLRKYITSKFPRDSQEEISSVFADALKRMIALHLPEIEASQKEKIQSELFRQTVHKHEFSIDYSDIFKATLKSRFLGAAFFNEMTNWMNNALDRDIKKENVFNFILSVYKLQSEIHEAEIGRIIEEAEYRYGSFITEDAMEPEREEVLSTSSEDISGIKDEYISDIDDEGWAAADSTGPVQWFDSIEEEETAWDIPTDELQPVTEQVEKVRYRSFADIIYLRIKEALQRLASGLEQLQTVKFPYELRVNYLNSIKVAVSVLIAAAIIAASGIEAAIGYGNTKNIQWEQLLRHENNGKQQVNPNGSEWMQDGTFKLDNVKKTMKMRATAYDLSFESCGKTRSHPSYGITFSGTRVKMGRTVAVDPEYIPLGSRLKISFSEKYKHLDGIYIAEDTGNKIKGNTVDVFFGEDEAGSRYIYNKAKEFGVQAVKVDILE